MRQRLLPALVLVLAAGHARGEPPVASARGGEVLRTVPEFTTFMALARSAWAKRSKAAAWRDAAPGVREVRVRSSVDGSLQPALFFDSGSRRAKPLLVVLHSWSADYRQHDGIPYALWAARNDWVFIHPEHRGPYHRPQATASRLAQRDVLDALRWARRHARVDPARIYLVGFSGGAMTALVLVGRYPELWTAAVAWVPVFDLARWYGETRHKRRFARYAADVSRSCGGAPLPRSRAEAECLRRSPLRHLAGARGRRVRVYLAAGLADPFVSPLHSALAFNVLAEAPDRLRPDQLASIAAHRLPAGLAPPPDDAIYESAGRPLLLERRSANVTLRLFSGKHDVLYNAGLLWLSLQRR